MEINVKIGNTELKFDGKNFEDVIKDAGALSQATQCGLCKSKNLGLDYRCAKGKDGTENAGKSFDYYSIKCLDCTAKAELGEYQTGGFFLKKWEKYDPNAIAKD